MDVMDIPDQVLQMPYEKLNSVQRELVAVATASAKVLDSITKSPKVKEELRRNGVVFLMARFLRSQHTELIISMMGAVQQCANMVGI